MGGPGSGRKAKPADDGLEISNAVQDAGSIATTIPKPKPAKTPTKAKRVARPPSTYKTHPLAQAINGFASKAAGSPGAAESCQLGEAWIAVLDYYGQGLATHPLAIALTATAQFAVVVAWSKQKNGSTSWVEPAAKTARDSFDFDGAINAAKP